MAARNRRRGSIPATSQRGARSAASFPARVSSRELVLNKEGVARLALQCAPCDAPSHESPPSALTRAVLTLALRASSAVRRRSWRLQSGTVYSPHPVARPMGSIRCKHRQSCRCFPATQGKGRNAASPAPYQGEGKKCCKIPFPRLRGRCPRRKGAARRDVQ